MSCASRAILLLQSRAKVSAEERDCIEETIEIILAELEEIQVRLQFHPEVAKKISESLKTTAVIAVACWSYFRCPSGFIGAHFACCSRPREARRGGYSQHPLPLRSEINQDGSGSGFRSGSQEADSGDE